MHIAIAQSPCHAMCCAARDKAFGEITNHALAGVGIVGWLHEIVRIALMQTCRRVDGVGRVGKIGKSDALLPIATLIPVRASRKAIRPEVSEDPGTGDGVFHEEEAQSKPCTSLQKLHEV